MRSFNCPNRRYDAQAVIIAMVVVVISVIIGMSVISRSLRDKNLALMERYSSEALEISDSVLNVLSTVENDKLFSKLEEKGGQLGDIKSTGELTKFIKELGVDTDFSSLFTSCQESRSASGMKSSNVTVSFNTVDSQELELLEPATVGYRLNPLDVASSCGLSISVAPRGVGSVGIVVREIYAKGHSNPIDLNRIEYKNYDFDDVNAYCVTGEGTCTNGMLASNNWVLQNKNNPIVIDLKKVKDGYSLDEVRITPVGGTAAITSKLTTAGCAGKMDLKLIKVAVTATCNGESRGKEALIPRSNNLSYSTTFDYVFYNNLNKFQPY